MSRPTLIAPSMLSADFAQLGAEAQAMQAAGADWLHFDVMDGHFVPNLTLGPMAVKALRSRVQIPLDVHLMMAPVDPFVAEFAAAGADRLTFHPEAGAHPHRTAQLIRSQGVQVGIALNPGTPVSVAEELLDDADLVLAMTVNPGFGGQAFIDRMLDKIGRLRRLIDASGRPIHLQVDGGINAQTAALATAAGADVLVAGTACFTGGAAAYAANIDRLRVGSPAASA